MQKTHKLFFLFILVISTLTHSAADTIYVNLPKVPKAPKVNAKVISNLSVKTNTTEPTTQVWKRKSINKPIGFSKRVPPEYLDENIVQNSLSKNNNTSRVSTFLETKTLPLETVKKRLLNNGFSVLSEYQIDKKGFITSIVFTSSSIVSLASKRERGFASTLRVLINKESKIMSITNPVYIMKAFLQKDYDGKVAQDTLQALNKAFKNLQASKDIVKFSKLDHYRYMDNMPYYQDMEIVASETNEKLLKHAHNSKKIIYEYTLDNGSIILGVKLSKRTSKFVKKIGYQNAGLLPYPILIENNKAKVLAPQYYIALMYPMLSMTKFMSIASVPGAIIKDCQRVFK